MTNIIHIFLRISEECVNYEAKRRALLYDISPIHIPIFKRYWNFSLTSLEDLINILIYISYSTIHLT